MKAALNGFSLIELMVTLVVFSVLLALAMPSYGIWISNTRIRTTAEAIQNGLQLARAEAVRRNSFIRFQLTSTLKDDCVLSTGATNWVVSYDDPTVATNKCASAPVSDAFPGSDLVHNPAPRIIQSRSAAEGSGRVEVLSNHSFVTFDGLGRPDNVLSMEVKSPAQGDCTKLRCLSVMVSLGGQVRMCDPNRPLGDPQRC